MPCRDIPIIFNDLLYQYKGYCIPNHTKSSQEYMNILIHGNNMLTFVLSGKFKKYNSLKMLEVRMLIHEILNMSIHNDQAMHKTNYGGIF